MTESRPSVRVKIFGTEYPLRGESEDLTKRVASYVDEMIGSVHKKLPDQPTLTVAVLSALNITEELLRERDHHEDIAARIVSEVDRISDFLERSAGG